MRHDTNIKMGWIKGMYIYTVLGAGGFGVMMIFAPKLENHFLEFQHLIL